MIQTPEFWPFEPKRKKKKTPVLQPNRPMVFSANPHRLTLEPGSSPGHFVLETGGPEAGAIEGKKPPGAGDDAPSRATDTSTAR
jgi:hypothetical protein